MSVVLAASLWGDHPLYCEGAVTTAKLVPIMQARTGVPLELWLYHDASVPQATLDRLAAHGVVLRGDAPVWAGERRAMWRFLALDETPRVYFIDMDVSPALMLHRKTLTAIRAVAAHPHRSPAMWTWRPVWRHQNVVCVPACYTGVAVAAPLGGRLRDALDRFAREHPPLEYAEPGAIRAKQHRYPNGYGLDEWFLRHYLRQRVLGPTKLAVLSYMGR